MSDYRQFESLTWKCKNQKQTLKNPWLFIVLWVYSTISIVSPVGKNSTFVISCVPPQIMYYTDN